MQREIITRRQLPHWYVPGAMHFVTYRLAGTIPLSVIRQLQNRKAEMLRQKSPRRMSTAEHRERTHKQIFASYDQYLDANRKIDWLARPEVAAIVRNNLYHHHGHKFNLLAYCIMPNHVHVLLQPISSDAIPVQPLANTGEWCEDRKSPLSGIMHSLKSYTANEANKVLGRRGAFWQKESYDHWVRDDDELERVIAYIIENPVKAKLVTEARQWRFSSAHDRYMIDGSAEGFLLDSASRKNEA